MLVAPAVAGDMDHLAEARETVSGFMPVAAIYGPTCPTSSLKPAAIVEC
jgi:hypothetical protein